MVILGNDAQLAARPATPVQLAHACVAAGFRAVVPASWGDELVAGATLDALTGLATRPAIHCACPHVARRVLAVGAELAPHLVSLVAPAVAAARYLRLHAVGDIRITYVGRCPAAADDSIDARLTPEELLAQLADRDIDLLAQPEVFESVIPPDRRRHLSLPGGLPSPDALWSRAGLAVETMTTADFATELAELVLAHGDAIIDPAPAVGCVCSGAIRGAVPAESRASVVALEPPRSAMPIVEESGALSLELPLPNVARDPADLVADRTWARDEHHSHTGPAHALGDAPPPPPVAPARRPRLTPPAMPAITAPPSLASSPSAPGTAPRRRSSVTTPRMVPGSVPVSSDSEGRILPRAYVARRRSPRSGIPVVSEPTVSGGSALDSIDAKAHQAREGAPRHTVPAGGEVGTAPASPDSERPVVRSVEPPVVPAANSALASPVTGARPAALPTPLPSPHPIRDPRGSIRHELGAFPGIVGTRLVRGAARLRERSRLMFVGAIAGTGLLLGVAIGYAVAHHQVSMAAGGSDDRGGDSLLINPERGSSGVRESVSAGGIAPATGATRRGPVRAPARGTVTGPRAGGRASAAGNGRRLDALPVVPGASPSVGFPASPPVAASPDSTMSRAGRDSVARAESLAAERESIRREIALRRARLDSIERARLRLDSLQRADQAGRPPDR